MNLEGNIGEIDLIERLVELWREQFTGAIRFENDGIIKILYFKQGDILSASTNDRADSIDEILMRAGKVSREHVKQALAKRKENETLGDALLNLGFITRKELSWARRVQVVGVIRSIAAWTAGSFTIVADYLPKRDEGTLFPLPQILVELIVTEQDRGRFESAMNGGDLVLERSETFDSVFPTLGLNEDADAIVGALDGTRSAREVANVSGRDTFNVYKLLRALSLLGLVREASGPKVVSEVSADAFDFGAPEPAPAEQSWSDFAAAPPAFDLDDTSNAPAIDFSLPAGAAEPGLQFPEEAPAAAPAPADAALSWDEAPAWESPASENRLDQMAPLPIPEPTPASKTIAWDTPAREPAAVPIQVPIEPPAEADEEQWGFDEAQLETSRRAVPGGAPIPKARSAKGGRRYGLIVALLAILILAGAGYGGWMWWSAREEAAAQVVEQPQPRPRPAATPVTDTTSTIVTLPTTTVAETPTQTGAPAPTVTAAPVPATTTAPAAAPAVPVAQTPERQRLDEMARQYAANPVGNYTVQIQILCDPGNLAGAVKAGGTSLWFVPQSIGGRPCYRVFWGRFNTDREAAAAMASIPRALRDPNAAVKAVPRG